MSTTSKPAAFRELRELKVAIAEKQAESEKIQSLIAEVVGQCEAPGQPDELPTLLARKAEAGVDWIERRLAGETDAPLPAAVTASTASASAAQKERAEQHRQLVEALAPALAKLRERFDACSTALQVFRWQQTSLACRFVADAAAQLVPELEASAKQTRFLASKIVAARMLLSDRRAPELLAHLPTVEAIEAMLLPLPGQQVEMERQGARKVWGEWVARLCADPDGETDEQAEPTQQAAQ